jgi:hypothetical protein
MPRLSHVLIERAARQMAHRLEELGDEVEIKGDRQSVEHHIIEAFQANFAQEDELETEARRLIDLHLRDQSRDSINYAEALKKAKAQLARQRGIVL